MLKHLKLKNIGPASSMELEFGTRLNILTGDDGLAGPGNSWLCNGLIRDWAGWQKEKKLPFQQLTCVCAVHANSCAKGKTTIRMKQASNI